MTLEDEMAARKDALLALQRAREDLRNVHDSDLKDLLADVRSGLVSPESLEPRKAGIKARYERDVQRLAIQYKKEGHNGR